MKKFKSIITLIVIIISCASQAQINDNISINKSDFKSEKAEMFDKVNWKSDYKTREVGNPELPVYRVSYVLPVDVKVTGVRFKKKKKEKHDNLFDIFPVQQPIPTNNSLSPKFTQPNNKVYLSDTPYPNKLYDIESDEFYMGYHIITLRIYPFEYLPKSKVLNYYSNLDFTIEYTKGTKEGELYPLTQNLKRAEQCKSMVKSMVKNSDDVERFGSNVQSIRDGNSIIKTAVVDPRKTGIQKTKAVSITDEIVPDYIIITNNALKPTFQNLADWKTKKGVFTIIKTTEEIDANYQGSDLQEKTRKFIIESMTKWGNGLFILLGGDSKVLPPRLVFGDYVYSSTNHTVLYPCDMYFSTYNGTWNTDGDNIYKESGEVTDWSTGVILGRVPIGNTTDALTYINKVITYEKAQNINDLNYLKNNLYADAYIGKSDDGTYLYSFGESSIKQYCSTYVSSTINNKFICDNAVCTGSSTRYTASPCPGGDIELNRDNFLSSLNLGGSEGKFHFIYHMDHGSSQSISTSGLDKGQGVTKMDMDGLTNGTSYQILMSSSCHSANFKEDCIAKHYLTNPNGGGVTWIGNTDIGWSSEYAQLSYFCDALYSTTGHPSLGRYDIGSVYQNVVKNGDYGNWRFHLLGDPEMQVWTNTPQTLGISCNPSQILIGQQTVNVILTNLPNGQKATICLKKGTEVYVSKEVTGSGTFPISFNAGSPGTINVTVTSHNYFPHESAIAVNQTTAPNLVLSKVDFQDGINGNGVGDGNGKNDAGEIIKLGVEIKNTGVSNAVFVGGWLSCNSPNITITTANTNFGTLASGTSQTFYPFQYSINKNAPQTLTNDVAPVQFTLTMIDDFENVYTQKFNVDVYKPDVKLGNKTTVPLNHVIVANETVSLNIDLQSVDFSTARGLTATLSSTSASNIISACSSTPRLYQDITQYTIKQSTLPFQFTTGANYVGDLSTLNFNLVLTNAYGKTWSFSFNLAKPSTITGLNFTADVAEIDLYWTPMTGVGGYNIYRCNVDQVTNAETSAYVKQNQTPVSAAYFNDINQLDTLKKYNYKVAAVGLTGNEGTQTSILAWTSFPNKNLFPITIDPNLLYFSTPINTADINNDGKKEIFVGCRGSESKGYLFALDHYGNELYNIDDNVTTYSGFAKLDLYPWAIPAIGDMNKTGKFQIVEPTRGSGQDNAVFCYSADHTLKPNEPDLLWKNVTPQKQYIHGAVLSNIDNSADGSLEVITNTDEKGSAITIYNSSGSLLVDIPSENTYGAISVADMDGDGDKEIIKASGTGIHVWHHNGTKYLGQESLYNLSIGDYSFRTSVIVCDIDNDGHNEIVTFALHNGSPYSAKLFAIKNNGTLVSGFDGTQTINTDYDYWQEFSVGDINNDGSLEIVTLGTNNIKVWNNHAQPILPISTNILSDFAAAKQPILGDVDGDGISEIVYSSRTTNNIYAYKCSGASALGFPVRASAGPCGIINISDVDNDGKNELLAAGLDKIEMWQTNGLSSSIEWGSERHDQYNTGEYTLPCETKIISSNTTWNSNQSICGDLIVKSGVLTVNSGANVSLSNSSMIIVMSGASLVVDAAYIQNANIRAMSGSNITITNNGKIVLRSNAEFYTETGCNLEIPYGGIDK